MSATQFNTYAKFYNLFYKDKDYPKEAGYIHALVQKYSTKNKKDLHLLDLACGTGRHLLELSKMGYQHLSGSDIAAPMIEVAKKNTADSGNEIKLYNYSFQQADQVPGKFDVVTSMFSAVNYIVTFEDQLKTFRNIHGLLEKDGIFIFDYWNGNAVTRDYSPVKILRKQDEDSEIVRISETSLDLVEQSVTVNYTCIYLENQQKTIEFKEVHHLHYYYFSEMKNLLEIAGFEIIHLSPFPEADRAVAPYDWNISIVAQKRN
jgi:SAM-dependent methyltransferase